MTHSLPFIALWLDPKSDSDSALHILSKDAHHRLALPLIGAPVRAVEEFLPEIVQFLPSNTSLVRWLLLLEPSLPESWLNENWEALNLDGQPISVQALVVRGARWSETEGRSSKPTKYLNLFPSSEFSFLEHLQPAIRSGALRRSVFPAEDMIDGHDLLVIAHGRQVGLVDISGNPFDMPLVRPMPKRIWLLACNVNGGMYRLAQRLLGSGCQSVITATADLSAPQMARLVKALFEPFVDDGESSWIARFVETLGSSADDVGLTVWGSVDLDTSTCREWNRLTWDKIHDKTNCAPLHEETSRDDFFAARNIALSSQTWPITRTWMLPSLLWLAELHDHPSMRTLSKIVGDSTAPDVVRGLAAIARRTGDYVQTAKFLSITLNLPKLPIEERANSLGQLANLFIDMNLPESALKAIELHERCNLNSSMERREANYRRLDWIARAQARCGRLDIALDHMTAKRRMAEKGTSRELAWQLYISTWAYLANQATLEQAQSFAFETAEVLGNLAPQDVGFGNASAAYLLRALSVHVWSSNDSNHIQILERWLEHAEHRLSDEDPGPWAYTIAFMFLKNGTTSAKFERAISALGRARYYFEASSLLSLAERESEQFDMLRRFQDRRNDVLAVLEANSIDSIFDARTEAERRAIAERKPFFDGTCPTHIGNLPL